MMTRCGWCGVEVGEPGTRCHRCGHRPDRPRPVCDCTICSARRARGQAREWTEQDRAELTRYAADRIAAMVRRALQSSPSVAASRRLGLLDFDEWSRRYRRNINADPVTHRCFRALDALGVDVETVLRRGYVAGVDAGRPL